MVLHYVVFCLSSLSPTISKKGQGSKVGRARCMSCAVCGAAMRSTGARVPEVHPSAGMPLHRKRLSHSMAMVCVFLLPGPEA